MIAPPTTLEVWPWTLWRWLPGFVVAIVFFSAEGAAQQHIDHAALRKQMVDLYVRGAGVKDERVLKSIEDTPRHEFMPHDVQSKAYLDAGGAHR